MTEPLFTCRPDPALARRAGGPLDSIVRIRRDGVTRDVASVAYDPAAGLIRAFASGEWTLAETERYVAVLAAFVEAARALSGKARVLLDRREVSAQSPTVAKLLADANGAIFRAEDKIALVVSSSLAKVSLRQRMPHAGTKAFLSIEAAETWLRAFAG